MVKLFEKGPGMHQQLQDWRLNNPDCFLINVRSLKNATLHTNYCSIHIAKPEMEETTMSLSNSTKVCSLDKSKLLQWAKENLKAPLKECKDCKP